MADNPHFDLPFRLAGNSFAVTEQDEYSDVSNCVEAILRTPVGWRDEAPEFGRPHILFLNQPIGEDLLTETIVNQEPRADVLVTEQPDLIDNLVDRIDVDVSLVGGDE